MGRTLPSTGEGELESTLAIEQDLSAPALVSLHLSELVAQWDGECAQAKQAGEKAVVQAYELAIEDTQWTLGEISALKRLSSQEAYITEAIPYLQELGDLARAVGGEVSTNKEYNEVYRLTRMRLHEQILLTLDDYAHSE